MPTRQTMTTAILLVAAVVAVAAVLVRLAESSLAFFPLRGESETPATYGVPYEAVDLATSDGERIHAWWLPRDAPRATVLYFHGNGGNLSLWAPILVDLWRHDLAVFAIDYRGYGRSTGSPSEAGLYRDVDAAMAAVHDRDRPSGAPLVYWGRSLGAVMAAYAASRRAPDRLVLEAGFPSMRALLAGSPLWLASWLSSYRFPAAEWLRGVGCPTLVLHGDRDSVIPFRMGQQLFESISAPRRFVTIAGGDHNDAQPPDPAHYWGEIENFLR